MSWSVIGNLKGPQGEAGPQGNIGDAGPVGVSGTDGSDGVDGLSAYDVAVANGFIGTEAAWLASLVGATGATGPQGPQGEPAPAGWSDYIFWPSVEAGLVAGGAVRSHSRPGQTVFRMIPSPYDPTLDAFYTTFTGGILSGLIVTRG